jgi:hypothetical protein
MFTLAKVSAIVLATMTHDSHTLELALATLGGVTEIGSFLLFVVPPNVAKASTVVTVIGLSHVAVTDGFANKLCQCK